MPLEGPDAGYPDLGYFVISCQEHTAPAGFPPARMGLQET